MAAVIMATVILAALAVRPLHAMKVLEFDTDLMVLLVA
jgi:hypothetical protein